MRSEDILSVVGLWWGASPALLIIQLPLPCVLKPFVCQKERSAEAKSNASKGRYHCKEDIA